MEWGGENTNLRERELSIWGGISLIERRTMGNRERERERLRGLRHEIPSLSMLEDMRVKPSAKSFPMVTIS